MSTRTKQMRLAEKNHSRSATIQWVAFGLVLALGLLALLLLTGDGPGGGHSGAPALLQL